MAPTLVFFFAMQAEVGFCLVNAGPAVLADLMGRTRQVRGSSRAGKQVEEGQERKVQTKINEAVSGKDIQRHTNTLDLHNRLKVMYMQKKNLPSKPCKPE